MPMSAKKKLDDEKGPHVVTLDQDEFNKVCKRVHSLLMTRVEKAREKKEKQPTKKSAHNHIEASKEVFVFVHLLELVENMTEEISDLRAIISQVTGDDDEETPTRNVTTTVPEMFSMKKKTYLN